MKSAMRYKIPPAKIKKWVEDNFEIHKTRKNGQELVIINPLTGHDKPRLNINIETGGMFDWGDNTWAGPTNPKTGKRQCNIINFVRLYKHLSFSGAIKELTGDASITYTARNIDAVSSEPEATEHLSVEIPAGFHPLDNPDTLLKRPLWNYLLSRGYTPEEIIEQRIHYRGSEILWLYTEFGELVYLQSRDIYTKRFWFPPTGVTGPDGVTKIGELDVTRDHVLYGFDDVPRAEYIILTESIFDKHTLGHHALSTGGVVLSNGQLQRIKLIGPNQGVVLAPDNDKPAVESILTNAPRLSAMGYKVFFAIPPQLPTPKGGLTKDWNELYTDLKLTKPQIVATMNQRLVAFNETTRLKLRQSLIVKPGASKNGTTKSFLA